jgi:FtsZ-interacting cell division protein ZipA
MSFPFNKPKKQKKAKTLQDKIREIDPNFVDEVSVATDDELKSKITTLTSQKIEVEEAQKNDPDIADVKEKLKQLKSTYTEPLKAYKLKIQFLVQLLKDRGKSS